MTRWKNRYRKEVAFKYPVNVASFTPMKAKSESAERLGWLFIVTNKVTGMLKKVNDLERLLDYIERKGKLGQNALRDMQYTTVRLDYIAQMWNIQYTTYSSLHSRLPTTRYGGIVSKRTWVLTSSPLKQNNQFLLEALQEPEEAWCINSTNKISITLHW